MSSRLEKIQAALAAAKNKGGEKKEFPKVTEISWKPKLGDNVVRLVMKEDQELPYFLVKYYDFGVLENYPILSPNSFGKFVDPIQKECYELRKSKDTDSIELAKQFITKEKYFFPVLVRGQESKGIQLWEVTRNKVDQVINLFTNEDYGDITDVSEGRDLTIHCKEGIIPTNGIKYPEIVSVIPKFKTSSLGTDDEIEKLMSNIPDVYSYYASKTNEELEKLFEIKIAKLLNKYQAQEEIQEESEYESSTEEPSEEPKKVEVKEVITKGGSAKKSASKEDDEDPFGKMFDENK